MLQNLFTFFTCIGLLGFFLWCLQFLRLFVLRRDQSEDEESDDEEVIGLEILVHPVRNSLAMQKIFTFHKN